MKHKCINAVDLFCGAGGVTSGLKAAARELGLELALTGINHWDVAIATHSSNHPEAEHLCTDVHETDPKKVVPGGHLQLLCAAPSCVHFSTARGGRPMSDQSRSSIMDILRWARDLTIDNILIENVPEIRTYGPLHKCTCGTEDPRKHAKGFECHRPIKHLRGIYFQRFVRGLQQLGYTVDYRIINAANYGDATTRKRFFLQAKLGGRPITWPEPSHLPKEMLKQPDLGMSPKEKPFRTAREIIDWTIPGKSIFGRKKDLAPNTIARIMAGLHKYSGLPFTVPQFSQYGPKGVEDPLGVITSTSRGIGLAEPFLVILRNNCDGKSVDGPIPSLTTGRNVGLAQPELHPFILPNEGIHRGNQPRSIDDPIPTVTQRGGGCLVEPCLIALEHGGSDHNGRTQPVDQPLKTVTAKGQFGLVEPELKPFVIAMEHSTEGHNRRCHDVEEPLKTVTGSGGFGLVTAEIMPFVLGQQSCSAPRDVDQPIPTVAGAGAIGLVTPELRPFLVGAGGPTGKGAPQSVDDPLGTVLAENHTAVCEPVILNMKGRSIGRGIDDPLPTMTAHSQHLGVIEPYLIKYHGGPDSSRRTHSVDHPVPTLDTSNRLGVAQPCLIKYNGTGGPMSVDEPLDTITARDRFGLVLPDLQPGEVYAYLDIKFRMLQPHELAAAMSFAADYKFSGNREAIVRQIGNAVACRTAQALCREILQ